MMRDVSTEELKNKKEDEAKGETLTEESDLAGTRPHTKESILE
jgi:hypothetical protein